MGDVLDAAGAQLLFELLATPARALLLDILGECETGVILELLVLVDLARPLFRDHFERRRDRARPRALGVRQIHFKEFKIRLPLRPHCPPALVSAQHRLLRVLEARVLGLAALGPRRAVHRALDRPHFLSLHTAHCLVCSLTAFAFDY